jgi:hypothetical protein
MQYLKSLLILLVLSAFFVACSKKEEETPAPKMPTVLEVMVTNTTGNAVGGVLVHLYKTEQDWKDEKNPVQTARTTDAAGKVTVTDLEAGMYYVRAAKEYLNNRAAMVSITVVQNKTTPVSVTIKEDRLELWAGLTSKKWKVIDKKVNGINVTEDCDKDDVYTVTRDGKMIINHSVNHCDTSEDQEENYTYTMNSAATIITLTYTETDFTEILPFTILTLSPSTCKISNSGNGYTYELTLATTL